jgi:hypothetical protein
VTRNDDDDNNNNYNNNKQTISMYSKLCRYIAVTEEMQQQNQYGHVALLLSPTGSVPKTIHRTIKYYLRSVMNIVENM